MGLLKNKDEVHSTSFSNQQEHDDNKGTTFGATHCSLQLDGNDVKIVWLSSTEKHLLTWDVAVVTFIKQNYIQLTTKELSIVALSTSTTICLCGVIHLIKARVHGLTG
jgi:hypothetical protein